MTLPLGTFGIYQRCTEHGTWLGWRLYCRSPEKSALHAQLRFALPIEDSTNATLRTNNSRFISVPPIRRRDMGRHERPWRNRAPNADL